MEELDTKYYVTVIVSLSIALLLIHLYQKMSFERKILTIKSLIIITPIILVLILLFIGFDSAVDLLLVIVVLSAISIHGWRYTRVCMHCKKFSFNEGTFFKPSGFCPHCGEKTCSI